MISAMILTYRYRIKDASRSKHLERHARAVNQVWNYCCEAQRRAMKWQHKWPTWVDLGKMCAGSSADLGLHSDTITAVCRRFVMSREAIGRCPRFRASGGPRRALGWIPVIPRAIQVRGDSIRYLRRDYRLWLSRDIPEDIRAGSFSQDARGRWYFNICVNVPEESAGDGPAIGIDLGLKTLAVCSNGEEIPNLRNYRRHEVALGKAQRAGNRERERAIHAKIANSRRHQHHEVSTRLVRANRRIVVGNVSASKLAKTNMAKSVLDAGWASFRDMLRYKAIGHGVEYIEVGEAFTTRVCSDCGSIGGPKGIADIGMRAWVCADCGSSHNRDVNAARNILRLGAECRPLVGEIAA